MKKRLLPGLVLISGLIFANSVAAQTFGSFQVDLTPSVDLNLKTFETSTVTTTEDTTSLIKVDEISSQNDIDPTFTQTLPVEEKTIKREVTAEQTAYTVTEGDFGTTILEIPVVLTGTGVAGESIVMNYEFVPGSATAGKDYVETIGAAARGTVTADGEITLRLPVIAEILGDTEQEKDEQFIVRLSIPKSSSGNDVALANGQEQLDITVTIVDDDTVAAEPAVVTPEVKPTLLERIFGTDDKEEEKEPEPTKETPTTVEPTLETVTQPTITPATDPASALSEQPTTDIEPATEPATPSLEQSDAAAALDDVTVAEDAAPTLSEQPTPEVRIAVPINIDLTRQSIPDVTPAAPAPETEPELAEASSTAEARPQAREDAPQIAKTFSPIIPTSVVTPEDLSRYASDVITRDEDVEDVSITEEEVSVSYRKPTKLFGFIPTTIEETVTVDTNGDVQVDRPWWAIFSNEEDSTRDVEEDVSARVDAATTDEESTERPTLLARILGAIDTSVKVNTNKATSFEVVDVFDGSDDPLQDLPEEDVLVSDLDALIRAAFVGNGINRPQSGSTAYLFVDLALQGMFGDISSQGLAIMQLTADSGGADIVAGIDRAYSYLDDRGITHQRDLFLRSSLRLEITRAIAGDASARAFVERYSDSLATILGESGVPLVTESGSASTIVSFPICQGDEVGCVNVAQLLTSIGDPRSLSSLCSPGTMVLGGDLNLGGDSRYGCPPPTSVCGGITGNTTDAGTLTPSLDINGQPNTEGATAADDARSFFAEQGLTPGQGQDLCGAHLAAMASMPVGSSQCIADAISQIARDDLLGATGMAGCMASELGLELGDDPAIDRVMGEVLNSAGCGQLASGGDKPAPAADEEKKPETAEKDTTKDEADAKPAKEGYSKDDKGRHVITKNKEGGGQLVVTITSLGGSSITNTGGTTPTQSDFNGLAKLVQDIVPFLDFGSQELADGIAGGTVGKIRQDAAHLALFKEYGTPGSSSGLDNDCSGAMQELQGAFDKCAGDISDQVSTDLGRAPQGRDSIVGTPQGSNPFGGRPGSYGEPAGDVDPITACMQQAGAGTHGSQNNPSNGGACGFVVCADGTDSCCGTTNLGSQAAGEALANLRDCAEVMCIPGQPCRCGGDQDPESSDAIPTNPLTGGDGGVNPVARDGGTVRSESTGFFGRVGDFFSNMFGR